MEQSLQNLTFSQGTIKTLLLEIGRSLECFECLLKSMEQQKQYKKIEGKKQNETIFFL